MELYWDHPGGIFSPYCPHHPCLARIGIGQGGVQKLQIILQQWCVSFMSTSTKNTINHTWPHLFNLACSKSKTQQITTVFKSTGIYPLNKAIIIDDSSSLGSSTVTTPILPASTVASVQPTLPFHPSWVHPLPHHPSWIHSLLQQLPHYHYWVLPPLPRPFCVTHCCHHCHTAPPGCCHHCHAHSGYTHCCHHC